MLCSSEAESWSTSIILPYFIYLQFITSLTRSQCRDEDYISFRFNATSDNHSAFDPHFGLSKLSSIAVAVDIDCEIYDSLSGDNLTFPSMYISVEPRDFLSLDIDSLLDWMETALDKSEILEDFNYVEDTVESLFNHSFIDWYTLYTQQYILFLHLEMNHKLMLFPPFRLLHNRTERKESIPQRLMNFFSVFHGDWEMFSFQIVRNIYSLQFLY